MSEVSIGGHFSVSLGLDDKYFPTIVLRILLEPLKSDDDRMLMSLRFTDGDEKHLLSSSKANHTFRCIELSIFDL